MSEFYHHYHRCETLAEFNFYYEDYDELDDDDDNYIYCMCSRVFIKDGMKTYYVEKEYASESDVEVRDSQSQDWDDHSHVHFSLDTSNKTKCEKDESASCYCSASHTENCCSTDEHDPAQSHGTHSLALQPSDSGADLTYQDYHTDTHDKFEKVNHDFTESNEDYLSVDTWEKFWSMNGERLIWASWIEKYSDYINPAYLNENSNLIIDERNMSKEHSTDQINTNKISTEDDGIRERKFSYDSKVNPYKKSSENQNRMEKAEKNNSANKEESWLSIGRRRSCSEHDRILSPRTLIGTDSMTNVTKLTMSSYDATSSHITSDSSPTDDYSVSSTNSDDQSNYQTNIANIDEKYDNLEEVPSEELDTEQYWQFLWKKHFGEQYALHYANYLEQHCTQEHDLPQINIDIAPEKEIQEGKVLDIEGENSEGNSQETPTVIEIQSQVEQIKIEEKVVKKRHNKVSKRYINSVGVLLQNLLKDEHLRAENEVLEAGESHDKNDDKSQTDIVKATTGSTNVPQPLDNSNYNSYNYDDGDDEPPEETYITLKRSHELDDEEAQSKAIKNTFQNMGYCVHPEKLPKGELIYRKRLARLRPPRSKRYASARKTYFDEDGNPYSVDQSKDSQDEHELQTDDDCTEMKFETENLTISIPAETGVHNTDRDSRKVTEEAAGVPLPNDEESDSEHHSEGKNNEILTDNVTENTECQPVETKRRRRPKRNYKFVEDDVDVTELPPELRDDPKMLKYWKKRHSLFHRFDEGVKLDRESWFSVTPENVAWHIANKYVYDVVLDAFCGAGGNTIQFARTSKKGEFNDNVKDRLTLPGDADLPIPKAAAARAHKVDCIAEDVIAVDIDPVKIEMAKHNAAVYGVADRIEFVTGDFFQLAPQLKADMVFLSPPWGGPAYSQNSEYDIESMLEPRPASELMCMARMISSTIALYLPRNTRPDQILSLAKTAGGSVEIEQSYLDKRFVAITAYFY